MDGLLNVLKPPGMTSFDVVSYVRKRTGGGKTGHAGTLDPGAAGVLPVCVGKATRLVGYMTDMVKEYRAEMQLGIETDTQDGRGKVVAKRKVTADRNQIRKTLADFRGVTEQIPPMYSAKKINGMRMYELARKGVEVERKPRRIEIKSINVVDIYDDRVVFDVECSKGTYIRTLCHDAGRMLGCGGYMKFLLRRRVGVFLLRDALTIENLAEITESLLLPMDMAVRGFGSVTLEDIEAKKLVNGQKVHMANEAGCCGEILRVYNRSGAFLALGEVTRRGGEDFLRPQKVFSGGNE